tara:strand:+ start:587 stop:1549 length:963 start_codon:yes stop_codon:yes gene_type:complete
MNNNVHVLTSPRINARNHIESLGSLPDTVPEYGESPVLYETSSYLSATVPELECSDTKRVIYNKQNDKLINVVGSKYRLEYQPKECINIVEEMLVNSGLDLTGLTRRYSESHDGGRYLTSYDLPAHAFDMGNGEENIPQILHRNSYDGSWPFTIEAGVIRMACTNGQVLLDRLATYTAKHTMSLNPVHGATKIAKCISTLDREKERWAAWRKHCISDMEAFKIFAKAAKFKVDPTMSLEEIFSSKTWINGRTKDIKFLWTQYVNKEVPALGANEWAVYNAMTHWSTHAEGNTKSSIKNIASTRIDRRDSIRKACTLLKAA